MIDEKLKILCDILGNGTARKNISPKAISRFD